MDSKYPIQIHVNCPKDNGNIEEMAASHQAALTIFRNQCPVGACVSEVVGIRQKGRYKCAWRVRYLLDGKTIIDSQLLVLEIRNSSPQNTEIVKNNGTFTPGLELDYSIWCNCKVSRNASMGSRFIQSASLEEIKSINIKTELVIKNEEDIQE